MAKSTDDQWGPAAKADLKNPTDPAQQVALGDQWWNLADAFENDEKESVQYRSAFWYQKAFPQTTGLAKLKVTKRMEGVDVVKLETFIKGKKRTASPVSGPSKTPDATKAPVYPTPEELKNFKEACKAASLSGGEKIKALTDLCKQLHRRLANDPSSWTLDGFSRRVQSEIDLNTTREGIARSNQWYTEVIRAWPKFAAAAKTDPEFLARLKQGGNEMRKYNLTQKMQIINARIHQALDLFFDQNKTRFAIPNAKSQFCSWLQRNGLDKAVLTAYLEQSKKE